ncbi:MAG: UDP-N-acetylmuramoyl-L-alanine--D-glutamate ligase [Planctomycetes bacterium]|nr:UDP-N-acetylmuramoyl-L-alanine--D-glutamate ligase [Planctomycetota bacterium]MBL7145051.1 UDP-N-acetylmuramoyl-L-alanine--D-glutamate ligase [Phycisphaerae bacterium]
MPDDRYNFAGKKVLIMGLGRFGGGVDCAEFAARAGAKVTVTDSAPAEKLSDSINKLKEFPDIEFHLGSHDPADFRQADIIIANPAVPDDNKFLEIARRNNKFITSQINIFFELCPAQIVGITGANGKSTTTALTAHLLKAMRDEGRWTRDVWLSGNIGNQPLLTILDKIKADDLVVLELSSFQLESLAQIAKAPKVALLTNLTPNHLDRHGTFENYCAAKENIFKHQELNDNSPAVSIFNAEDKIAAEWFEKFNKDTGRICIRFSTDDVSKEIRDSFILPGRANLSNLAAAIAISKHFGIDDEQIKKSLPEFKPLPHRLEFVAEINGVSWYNDSIATTPQSAIAALEAFEQPKIIIAGGYDKNLPFDELGQKIAAGAKAAVLLGQTAPKIASAIRKTQDSRHKTHVEFVDSLAKAVQSAERFAESGDVVLLSPACASYDMFENFQHRGQEFTKLVKSLNK